MAFVPFSSAGKGSREPGPSGLHCQFYWQGASPCMTRPRLGLALHPCPTLSVSIHKPHNHSIQWFPPPEAHTGAMVARTPQGVLSIFLKKWTHPRTPRSACPPTALPTWSHADIGRNAVLGTMALSCRLATKRALTNNFHTGVSAKRPYAQTRGGGGYPHKEIKNHFLFFFPPPKKYWENDFPP
jgi:hypothetical protein